MLSDQHSQHDEGQLHFLGSDDHFMHPDDDFMGPDEQEEDYYYPGQISRQHSDMEAGESASIEHLQSSDGCQYGYGENSDQFRGNAELYPRQRAAYRRQEDLNSDQGGHYEDEVFGFGSQDMDGDSGQLSCGRLSPTSFQQLLLAGLLLVEGLVDRLLALLRQVTGGMTSGPQVTGGMTSGPQVTGGMTSGPQERGAERATTGWRRRRRMGHPLVVCHRSRR